MWTVGPQEKKKKNDFGSFRPNLVWMEKTKTKHKWRKLQIINSKVMFSNVESNSESLKWWCNSTLSTKSHLLLTGILSPGDVGAPSAHTTAHSAPPPVCHWHPTQHTRRHLKTRRLRALQALKSLTHSKLTPWTEAWHSGEGGGGAGVRRSRVGLWKRAQC